MQLGASPSIGMSFRRWFNRFWVQKFSNPNLQGRLSNWPIFQGVARREGEEIFDLVMGFINSQVLLALVEMGILRDLREGPKPMSDLAIKTEISLERCEILCRAGMALGLLKLIKSDVALTRKGAVLIGVPGLPELVEHHRILYRDLEDSTAFFRSNGATELAQFWPYVFGQPKDEDPKVIAQYSELMRASLDLVAQDTLGVVKIKDAQSWLDIGGGSGGFIQKVQSQHPKLKTAVFDLPHTHGENEPYHRYEGSFLTDPLPSGYDVMSLIRVLYDHTDETVLNLLTKVYNSLPKNGQIIISEPMTGGKAPHKSGDVYFSIYTMAMQTGKTRSQDQISDFLIKIGFSNVQKHKSKRPFVTSIITARRN